jgi:hypothetical protein
MLQEKTNYFLEENEKEKDYLSAIFDNFCVICQACLALV